VELLFDYWKEKEAAVAAVDKRVIDHVLANPNIPLRKLAPLFGLNAHQMQYIVKKTGTDLKTGRKCDAE
jgi:hypothetical protein